MVWAVFVFSWMGDGTATVVATSLCWGEGALWAGRSAAGGRVLSPAMWVGGIAVLVYIGAAPILVISFAVSGATVGKSEAVLSLMVWDGGGPVFVYIGAAPILVVSFAVGGVTVGKSEAVLSPVVWDGGGAVLVPIGAAADSVRVAGTTGNIIRVMLLMCCSLFLALVASMANMASISICKFCYCISLAVFCCAFPNSCPS